MPTDSAMAALKLPFSETKLVLLTPANVISKEIKSLSENETKLNVMVASIRDPIVYNFRTIDQ